MPEIRLNGANLHYQEHCSSRAATGVIEKPAEVTRVLKAFIQAQE